MPEPVPPATVVADLLRVCDLVSGDGAGRQVGDIPAGDDPQALAAALYGGWYTLAPDAPVPAPAGDPPVHAPTLYGALRAAGARAPASAEPWIVTAASPQGAVTVARGERTRALHPGEYVSVARAGAPVAPGEPVHVVAEEDLLDAERLLWWTLSDPPPQEPYGRLYLNPRAATAPRVVHEVTRALQDIPFRVKCPIDPFVCARVDAIVVYHDRARRPHALAALAARMDVLAELLDPAVPPLTCRAAPGLAWADDVEHERSYGESRCHILAEAIVAAGPGWARLGRDARLDVLAAGLSGAGVDACRPWLREA